MATEQTAPLATSANTTSAARCPTPDTPGTSSRDWPPKPATTTRSDAPAVKHARRGSATAVTEALLAMGPDRGMVTMIEDLEDGRYAKTGTGPQASLVKTWAKYHGLAFATIAPAPPLLPVTPRIIVAVGALFKKGGYRSFSNYASAMRSRHIEAGYSWCQLLSHTANWVTRSVNRGIGPARQSCSFDFAKLCKLPRTPAALIANGPQHPVVMAILSSQFLLREVEASTARTDAWTFDHEALELKWNLPASKSDHMALGVARSWPCLCDLPDFACPYHVAVEHMAWLRSQPNFVDGNSAPLFPTMDWQHPGKRAVVDTFELLGGMMGQPLFSSEGMRMFGGHTPRVTGARTFAELGVEVNKLKILARHSGDTILRYVADTPLRALRSDLGLSAPRSAPRTPGAYGSAPRTPSAFGAAPSTPMTFGISKIPAPDSRLAARVRKIEAALSKLESDMTVQAQDIVGIATGFARTDNRIFVQNTDTATVHFARANDDGHTACGWRFATARSTYRILQTLLELPSTMLCERCLPTERIMAATILDPVLSGDEGRFEETDLACLEVA